MDKLELKDLKLILRFWGEEPPFRKKACTERITEILQNRENVNLEEILEDAEGWKEEEKQKEKTTLKELVMGVKSSYEACQNDIELLRGEVNEMRSQEETKELEKKVLSLEEEVKKLSVQNTPCSSGMRHVQLPKLTEFPTRKRFISAFKFIGQNLNETEKVQYLMAENMSTCPDLLTVCNSLRTSDKIIEFLENHPLDIGRAKSTLNNITWNQKEAPELMFIRIEAFIDQAYTSWGDSEKFREAIRYFWKALNKPEWKADVIRLGNEIDNRDDFLKLIRQLEQIEKASKGPLNEVFATNRKPEVRCYSCQETGHVARNCSVRGKNFCMHCGKHWHKDHKCYLEEDKQKTEHVNSGNGRPYRF